MSNDITLAELQEFIAGFWYHYDEAHYDELAVCYAEDVRYLTRSDSGSSPFEELMSPELHGRDAVVRWLSEHREQSPYPLRHHSTNVHRTALDGDITRARFRNRAVYRLAAFDDLPVRLADRAQPDFNVAQYRFGVFRARVVGRCDYYVTQGSRGFAHRCALRPVAVAAAAEDRYDPAARHVARGAKDVSKRVVRVRVVHDDGEVSLVRDAFEAAGRAAAVLERVGGRVEAQAQSVCARGGREDVVDVRPPDERRRDIALAFGRSESHARARHRELDAARRHFRVRVNREAEHASARV